ncbi:MAG: hypothetical protein B7X78_00065 [Sphingomonadales bacterium 39-62-4]|nr:MAG: hypothetical protein B7X78_00065 [Sphingomonadales bacterium 39-62-4]
MRDGTPHILSLKRTLSMLEAVIADGGRSNVSGLARQIGVPMATAHRQVTTLVAEGYLTPSGGGRHVAGSRLLGLLHRLDEKQVVANVAAPLLHRLAVRVRSVVQLGTFENDMVTYRIKTGRGASDLFTRIGIKGRSANERGEDVYANRGRSLIRGILESARAVRSEDTSEAARAARTIRTLGDLNGLEFVAKVGIDRDRKNPEDDGRNVIAAAITAEHADYMKLMGGMPATVVGAPAAASAAPSGPAPSWAGNQPGAAPPAASAPFWAR